MLAFSNWFIRIVFFFKQNHCLLWFDTLRRKSYQHYNKKNKFLKRRKGLEHHNETHKLWNHTAWVCGSALPSGSCSILGLVPLEANPETRTLVQIYVSEVTPGNTSRGREREGEAANRRFFINTANYGPPGTILRWVSESQHRKCPSVLSHPRSRGVGVFRHQLHQSLVKGCWGGRGFVGIGMDIFPSTSGLLQQPGKQMQTLAVESQPVPTEMVSREGVLTAPLHYLAL